MVGRRKASLQAYMLAKAPWLVESLEVVSVVVGGGMRGEMVGGLLRWRLGRIDLGAEG